MKIYKYGLIILLLIIAGVTSCKKIDDNKNKKEVNKSSDNFKEKGAHNNVLKMERNKKNNTSAVKIDDIKFSSKKPVFETTDESVKLRYKFKIGKKINIVQSLKMSVRYNNSLTFINTKLYGYYEVKKKLKDGKYEIQWIISRITTDLKVVDRNGKEKVYKYDSESENNTLAGAKVLRNLINTTIKAKTDNLGNISDIDLKSVLRAMDAGSGEEKFKDEISKKADLFVNLSFILLPANEVKTGDKYTGRKGMQESPMLKMESQREYAVDSVSKDKKFIVLKPSVNFKLNSDIKGSNIDIKKNEMTGWILFDNEKGLVKEFYTHTRMSMKVNKVDMKMDMKSSFKVIE